MCCGQIDDADMNEVKITRRRVVRMFGAGASLLVAGGVLSGCTDALSVRSKQVATTGVRALEAGDPDLQETLNIIHNDKLWRRFEGRLADQDPAEAWFLYEIEGLEDASLATVVYILGPPQFDATKFKVWPAVGFQVERHNGLLLDAYVAKVRPNLQQVDLTFQNFPEHSQRGIELHDHVEQTLKEAKQEHQKKQKGQNNGPGTPPEGIDPESCHDFDPYRDCWCEHWCGGYMDDSCLLYCASLGCAACSGSLIARSACCAAAIAACEAGCYVYPWCCETHCEEYPDDAPCPTG